MILSFALTTREFLSGKKTETRRDWKPRTLAMWQRAFDSGDRFHDAVDRGLHRGGKRIGRFVLTARPFQQRLYQMEAADLKAEGGMCVNVIDFCNLIGKRPKDVVTVIRFRKTT